MIKDCFLLFESEQMFKYCSTITCHNASALYAFLLSIFPLFSIARPVCEEWRFGLEA